MAKNTAINLDYRDKKNKIKIQKLLRELPPLAKFPGGKIIELIEVENAMEYMINKYEVCVQWISFNINPMDDHRYTASVMCTKDLSYISSIYAVEMYELVAKLAILIYSEIKSGRIPKR